MTGVQTCALPIYCSQRFVERAPETSKKNIEDFIHMLRNLEFDNANPVRIELWGGEPLLYIKTIVPLVEQIRKYLDSIGVKHGFSLITNGSLLTEEICDWIVENLQGFAISHDGPGQAVRGPDPFDDQKIIDLAVSLYKRMNGKMSFNAMINSKNISRKDIYNWFREKTGIEEPNIGEGGFVDAYDEGGLNMSLSTKEMHFNFRKLAFKELFALINAAVIELF
mgnify:FL=1